MGIFDFFSPKTTKEKQTAQNTNAANVFSYQAKMGAQALTMKKPSFTSLFNDRPQQKIDLSTKINTREPKTKIGAMLKGAVVGISNSVLGQGIVKPSMPFGIGGKQTPAKINDYVAPENLTVKAGPVNITKLTKTVGEIGGMMADIAIFRKAPGLGNSNTATKLSQGIISKLSGVKTTIGSPGFLSKVAGLLHGGLNLGTEFAAQAGISSKVRGESNLQSLQATTDGFKSGFELGIFGGASRSVAGKIPVGPTGQKAIASLGFMPGYGFASTLAKGGTMEDAINTAVMFGVMEAVGFFGKDKPLKDMGFTKDEVGEMKNAYYEISDKVKKFVTEPKQGGIDLEAFSDKTTFDEFSSKFSKPISPKEIEQNKELKGEYTKELIENNLDTIRKELGYDVEAIDAKKEYISNVIASEVESTVTRTGQEKYPIREQVVDKIESMKDSEQAKIIDSYIKGIKDAKDLAIDLKIPGYKELMPKVEEVKSETNDEKIKRITEKNQLSPRHMLSLKELASIAQESKSLMDFVEKVAKTKSDIMDRTIELIGMKMKETNTNADYSLALADIYHNFKPTPTQQVKPVEKKPAIPLNEYQYMKPSEKDAMKEVTRSKTLTDKQKQDIIDKAVEVVKTRMAGEEKPLSDEQRAFLKGVTVEELKGTKKKGLIGKKKVPEIGIGEDTNSIENNERIAKNLKSNINNIVKDLIGDTKVKMKNNIKGYTKSLWYRATNAQHLKKFGSAGSKIHDLINDTYIVTTAERNIKLVETIPAFESLKGDKFFRGSEGWIKMTEGKIPVPEKYKNAVDTWNATAEYFDARARELIPGYKGIKGGYVPRVIKADKLTELQGKREQEIIDELVKAGNSEERAKFIYNNSIKKGVTRYGHLEIGRTNDKIPSDRLEVDPLKIIPDYIVKASKRLNEIEKYGLEDEVLHRLYSEAEKSGQNYKRLKSVTEESIGRNSESLYEANKIVSDWITGPISTVLLPLNAVQNLGDFIKSMSMYGVRRTLINAVRLMFNKSAREIVQKAGANRYEIGKFAEELGLSSSAGVSAFAYKWTGQRLIEEWVRATTMLSSVDKLNAVVRRLNKNPNSKGAIRQLGKYGLKPEDVRGQTKLTEAQEIQVAIQSIMKTQPVGPTSVPLGWKTPVGRVMTQFRPFGYKHMEWLGKEVIGEAKHGNVGPMIRFLVIGALVGEGVADMLARLRGKDRTKNIPKRIMQNYLQVGGIGYLYNILNNVLNSDTFGWGFVMGAGPGVYTQLVTAIIHDVKAKIKGKKFANPLAGGISDLLEGKKARERTRIKRLPTTGKVQSSVGKYFASKALGPFGPAISQYLFPSKNKIYQSDAITDLIWGGEKDNNLPKDWGLDGIFTNITMPDISSWGWGGGEGTTPTGTMTQAEIDDFFK